MVPQCVFGEPRPVVLGFNFSFDFKKFAGTCVFIRLRQLTSPALLSKSNSDAETLFELFEVYAWSQHNN